VNILHLVVLAILSINALLIDPINETTDKFNRQVQGNQMRNLFPNIKIMITLIRLLISTRIPIPMNLTLFPGSLYDEPHSYPSKDLFDV
jgi:hypothetical protein